MFWSVLRTFDGLVQAPGPIPVPLGLEGYGKAGPSKVPQHTLHNMEYDAFHSIL